MYKAIFFDHYSQVPDSIWHYPDFTPKELSSKGNSSLLINHKALQRLQLARTLMGKPFVINSAFRDPIYNARIGGAPLSAHKQGHAFDISLHNHNRWHLLETCKKAGFTGFGFYETFLHVDCGKPRSWGSWA